ncbi:hypothetical protein BDV28DRAFT_114227 [Aspergillus coremiiformis]|uniref:Glycosyl hydrolase family 61-domain-containing protein n=1 Tax=Aspergillus coremiiformis TaxID=138285 RepID=A0A5N6Z620_9EURO|nr:hypothetical protein BDV28DRAFT_114227 [Aspergillus coremiiformis]
MFSKAFFALALLGASAVEAHMIMQEPVPYGKDSLNNSPLEDGGADFPCKLRANAFQITKENTAAIGQSMPLSFMGSATHGGGSCQVSLTTDREPTKNSKWMVIKSIEGGCPANVAGNMAGGPSATGASTFNYTIPDGIQPGKYTLAWTWFNRIGNREMYMNCAPLTVTGGSSKRDEVPDEKTVEKRAASFPPMFVANVNGCLTKEGVDVRFPNPGSDVVYAGTSGNLAPQSGAACQGTPKFGGDGAAAGASGSSSSSSSSSGGSSSGGSSSGGSSSGGSSSGGSSSGSTGSSPVPPVPAPSSTLISKPSQSSAPGVFAPTSQPTPPAQPSHTSTSSSGSGSGSGSSSGSSSGAQTGACSQEGAWNCIGGSSFQRCAEGKWTPAQQMAAGTQCNAGQGDSLKFTTRDLKPRMLHEMRRRRRNYSHTHA